MVRLRPVMLATAILSLALVVLVVVSTAAAAPAADPVKGKTLWEASLCAKCHGAQGQGLYAGPRAGDTRTPEQWITQVRTPRAQMPSFKPEKVSDQDIRDMNEYMKTLPAVTGFAPPQYPGAATDPDGKKLIFAKRCVACHGENGPVGNFTSTSRTPTAEAVIQQLRAPKNNMPLFSATFVTDADATAIATFMAQFVAAQAAPAAAPAPAAPAILPKSGEPATLALAALGLFFLTGGLAARRIR